MKNPYFHTKNILLFEPYQGEQTLSDLIDIIERVNPSNHVIIWNPWESFDERFWDYLNHDYKKNPTHDPSVLRLEQLLTTRKIMFYLVVGCEYSDAYINIKTNPIENFEVLFWPTAYFHHTYYSFLQFYKKTPLEAYDKNKKIDKLYLNLNNNDRHHRCLTIDYLCKYKLMDYGDVSWNKPNCTYNFSYFKCQTINYDGFRTKQYVHENYSHTLLNNNSLIDVVTESYPANGKGDILFYTEKTCKSIFFGKPLMIVGCKNQNINLEKYGFILSREHINYDFDNALSIKSRILGIVDNLYSLKDKNYDDLMDHFNGYNVMNIQNAMSIVNNDRFIPLKLKSLIFENFEEYKQLFDYFNGIYRSMYNLDDNFFLTDQIFNKKKYLKYI